MSRRNIYLATSAVIAIFLIWSGFKTAEEQDNFKATSKIALRAIGDQLYISNKDTTSLVLPVIALDRTKYALSFDKNLSFKPGDLVTATQQHFQFANLPEHYRVEVVQCVDEEIAYSYEMKGDIEKSIIPCSGRFLPLGCYHIQVQFLSGAISNKIVSYLLYGILGGLLLLWVVDFYKRKPNTSEPKEELIAIGSFNFYPIQHKLIRAALEIKLSKKEVELLAIFAEKPNSIIKRDEFMKRVWEDKGVIVGRSLDTYISKLRKKLKEDTSIKIVNVHGVGYKFEVL